MPRRETTLRAQGQKLRLTAQAAGAHGGTLRQGIQRVVVDGKEGVRGVFALGNGAKHQTFGQFHGHILHGMHGKVGSAVQKRFFDFLDEQALAADFGQRNIQNDVALGFENQQFNGNLARMLPFDAILDVVGLPECELGAARGDDDVLHFASA